MNAITKTLTRSWNTPANRLDWIMAGIAAGRWAYGQVKTYQAKQRKDIVLRFSDRDEPFSWLMKWLQGLPHDGKLNSFRVLPITTVEFHSGWHNHIQRPPALVPTIGVSFKYRGIDCSIEQHEQGKGGAADLNSLMEALRSEGMIVRFQTTDISVCQSFLDDLAGIASAPEPPKVMVYSDRGWRSVRPVPQTRSAILPAGQAEEVFADIKHFMSREEWYWSVGVPYRRGYLLHGIPGSGKTTLVIDIAARLSLNVLIYNLAEMDNDDLRIAIANSPKGLQVLEDIDCAFHGRDQKEKGKKGVTFAGLLNELDGAATPEGRITFMTTNHREKLDPALIRPGRVDRQVEFTHADAHQISELARRFDLLDIVDVAKWADEWISMAQVQERLVGMNASL